ncbi:MAG: SpoIIE family protein phosphatase, partial [Actinomycetota bacterium]|nr:SpoIIE family protein phosphatase [Actinomycetota bacterium]
IEYLQNMGVRASMSISLLRHGQLWGLIACHHYSGPHLPPFGTRAAAEFLGATLSLRLVDQFEEDQLQRRLAAREMLAELTAKTLDDDASLATALLGTPNLLDLVPADGVAVHIQGEQVSHGSVPPPEAVAAVIAWARGVDDEIVSTDRLADALPDLDLDPQVAAGALALELPDGQYLVWFRREVLRSVDWGGDPHNKAIAVAEGDGVRLSPRKSFDRWREVVHLRSEPWALSETESAAGLRRHLVETLYRRTRGALRVAEILQRSLMPESLPALNDWELTAHYQPAAGGDVGGDWYDAFELPDGRLIMLLGDVAGHGISVAGTMAQVRSVLRAQLFAGVTPAQAVQQLNEFAVHMLPGAFATAVVARVDLGTGHVEACSAGHLMPYLTNSGRARQAPIRLSPPVGARGASYTLSTFTIEPGHGLVMYSDGLIERRGEAIDDGIDRLAKTLGRPGDTGADSIVDATRTDNAEDDITILTLRRH